MARVIPSHPDACHPSFGALGGTCSHTLSFSAPLERSDNSQSVSHSKTCPRPPSGQVQGRDHAREGGPGRRRRPLNTGLLATSDQPPSGDRDLLTPPRFAALLGPGLGTYRRAGVPRGVCGERRRLAPRGWAGAGPAAPLHGHVEELKLEEPREERTVALQPPAEKKMVRREALGPSGTPVLEPRRRQHHAPAARGRLMPRFGSHRSLLYARATFPEIRSEPKTTTRSVEALGSSSPLRKGQRRR